MLIPNHTDTALVEPSQPEVSSTNNRLTFEPPNFQNQKPREAPRMVLFAPCGYMTEKNTRLLYMRLRRQGDQ